MNSKILLCNWTHRHNVSGGTENRYGYLKQIFPDAEIISYTDLFNDGDLKIKNYKKAVKQMDEYYIKRYEKDKNILIIRDAEFGGILNISNIPQITIFGNPYNSIKNLFNINYPKILLNPKSSGIKVAVSNFMKDDMKKIGLIPNKVIPNPVDINFFKPVKSSYKKTLREKYGIPKDKKVGIWVGSSDNPIKNIAMISKLVNILDIVWILVVKNKTDSSNKKVCKVFYNVNREIMRDLYNCADFFILTSPIEGCSHTIFEAMACQLPCIVSQTGYFLDFWDNRIGFRIKWNDLLVHIGAIKMINNIKTDSRQVIIDRGLDLKNWEEKWKKLIK